MKDEERRVLGTSLKVEYRQAEGEAPDPVIRGHAAVFDKLSENLGGFREKIQPGAFDRVLDNDVRALFNHDPNQILGRTSAGTLRVGVDADGLTYEIDPPDTQLGRDLLVSIERGDIRESSFGFIVGDDDWEEDEEGRVIRTVTEIRELFDVSPVSFPAYPDADVGLRELRNWRDERDRKQGLEEARKLQVKAYSLGSKARPTT